MKQILVIEKSPQMSHVLCDFLRSHGLDVVEASDAVHGLIQAGTCDYDFAILSDRIEGMVLKDFIISLRRLSPDLRIIIIAPENAVTPMGSKIEKLSKPVVLAELWSLISHDDTGFGNLGHAGK